MSTPTTLTSSQRGALYGMFIGDALAMPVHWYYDTLALQRDYGTVTDYLPPQNPHPDSILWRSSYYPPNKNGDILHDQAQFWGQKGIHYHQFLKAGENTLNLKICRELLLYLYDAEAYHPEDWLEKMIAFLLSPTSHSDTYVEEYLRVFFTNYANGRSPQKCAREDEKHIGGYCHMLPLLLILAEQPESARSTALKHLALTHGGHHMRSWGEVIADTLLTTLRGEPLDIALRQACRNSSLDIDIEQLSALQQYPDTTVIGHHFSSACYIEHAVPATIYLALKYVSTPEDGLIANTMCGGDNAGRGSLLGALLGAANGFECWPQRWLEGLHMPPPEL